MEKNKISHISKPICYNITNAETLCIQCEGWGKVAINKNYPDKVVNCPTCLGSLIITSKQAADILGSSK